MVQFLHVAWVRAIPKYHGALIIVYRPRPIYFIFMTFRSSQLGKFNLSRYVFVLQSLQSTEFLIIISILEKNTKQLCHRYYYIKTGVGPMLKMEYFNIRNKYPADGSTILYIISCKINVRGAHACGITLNCLRRGPSYEVIPEGQCRINNGADGARARAPGRGAPEQNTFFLRQRELVVGCTAHGTCLS